MAEVPIKEIEEGIERAKELAAIYDEISKTEIPQSVKEARESGWTLTPKGIQIDGLSLYDFDDRQNDGTRAISLTVALRLIEGFEDGLLAKTVKNPRQIFVSKVRGLVGLVQHSISAVGILWDEVKKQVDVWDILDLLAWLARLGFITDLFTGRAWAMVETIYELARRYLVLVFSAMLAAFAVPLFSATALAVEKEREFWSAQMRKNALPKRGGKRVWVRRVSRL